MRAVGLKVLKNKLSEYVRLVASGRLTARDVMDSQKVVATRAAIERLQEVLG